MYDLLDCPVAELAATDRFLLDAMRAWTHAMTLARSPRPVIGARFADDGFAFDTAMGILDRGSDETLIFNRPCDPVVGDDEAAVLGLWRLALDGRSVDAIATARMLVRREVAVMLVETIRRTLRKVAAT